MSTFDPSDMARSILEMLPVGVCVIDTDKKIVIWSDGAERITGHLRHEVIGHSCIAEALLHCDQPGCEYCSEECPMARAMKTAQPVQACGFVHHKAGHQVGVRMRAAVVRNAHGSIVGAVETFEEAQSARSGQPETFGLPGSLDEVTGLAGRAMMQLHLRQAVETFENIQVPFAVLCFRLEQLDRFRASFGPEAASSLLHVVARTLEGALWKTDFVGRWSDDSFLVILHGCREDALHAVRDRVQRLLRLLYCVVGRKALPPHVNRASHDANRRHIHVFDAAGRAIFECGFTCSRLRGGIGVHSELRELACLQLSASSSCLVASWPVT